MPRPKHYVPEIRKNIVSAIYHEAKGRGIAMTVLTNQILENSLKDTEGWKQAMALQESGPIYSTTQQKENT